MKRKCVQEELRNRLNRIPEDLREIYHIETRGSGRTRIRANKENGWRLMTRLGSLYHRNTGGSQGREAKYNRKFIRPDEQGGSVEAVICFPPGKDAYLVTDPLNCGTYNFVSPIRCKKPGVTPGSLAGHLHRDVLPYLKHRHEET